MPPSHATHFFCAKSISIVYSVNMKTALRAIGALLLPVLDTILPERARAARIRKRSMGDFQLIPTEHSLLDQKITTLLDYKDPGVSDLVRALKYEHSGR